MGHSIGVEAKGGGTLGAYLNLIDPDDAANKTTVFLMENQKFDRTAGAWILKMIPRSTTYI